MSTAPQAAGLAIRPVTSKADRKAFVELAYRLNLSDPNWIPPLKDEVYGLITPGKNPWFEHAEAAFFLAEQGGRVVGRISAQVDRLVQEHMGQGLGHGAALGGKPAGLSIAGHTAPLLPHRFCGKPVPTFPRDALCAAPRWPTPRR